MSTPIDPASISTWEDAFQYSIPQVRQLERQLRADLATNKEKLRGLVGESYRDLLQTAERIISMDVAAQNVEGSLGDASRNCNSRLLGRKEQNLKTFNEKMNARNSEKYTFAAQLAVLQTCPSVISQLLHQDDKSSCLLAAKVTVISRLLLKSLSEKASFPLLTTLQSQLSALRPILLQHIDALISSPTSPLPVLVSALVAFSILKKTSSLDGLRHFLSVRSTALSSLLSRKEPNAVVESLALFKNTLEVTHEIFPRQLQQALLKIKSLSLFEDSEVESVLELTLDTNGRWIPEDIRKFTPWVKHDDLETTKVQDLVKSWTEREIKKFKENLHHVLQTVTDIPSIIHLRSRLITSWNTTSTIRRKFNLDQSLTTTSDDFRKITMTAAITSMQTTSSTLQSIPTKIESLLSETASEAPDSTSLWLPKPLPIDTSTGAAAFRKNVSNRVHGHSPTVLSFLDSYTTFTAAISTIATSFRSLSNPPSLSPSHDLEELDFEAEELQQQADAEDSLLADKALLETLDTAYRKLETELNTLLATTPLTLRQTVFLLRCIRAIRQAPPKRDDGENIISLSWFGTDAVQKLNLSLGAFVTVAPLSEVESVVRERKWEGKVVGRALWESEGEGEECPIMPSLLCFRLLGGLVREMRNAGEDVWTPTAVRGVKSVVVNRVWRVLEGVLEGRVVAEKVVVVEEVEGEKVVEKVEDKVEVNDDDVPAEDQEGEEKRPADDTEDENKKIAKTKPKSPQPNGEKEKVQQRTISKDWILQLMFDALYLDEALQRRRGRGSINGNSVTSLAGKVDAVVGEKLGLGPELRMRLECSASEYWKKTCLLFALLG